ncbi:MAG: hypothetical protein U9R32_11350 [Bacteroidota bacterium]|nr:hypothetical protein [Bacteroidota bacterium]
MRNSLVKLLIYSFLFIVSFKSVSAQHVEVINDDEKYEGMSIGLGIGATHFYCDVSEKNFFQKWGNETKTSGHLYIGKDINSWLTLRGHMFGGRLKSYRDLFDDGRVANLFIDTKYFEIAAEGKFIFSSLWMDFENVRSPYEVYGIAGFGFASWDALLRDAVSMDEIDYKADQTNMGFVTNFGLGASYNFYDNWSAFLEGSVRPVFSEKVDMVDGGFKMDVPVIMTLGVSYKFSDLVKKKKSPKKKSPNRDREIRQADYSKKEGVTLPKLKIMDFPDRRPIRTPEIIFDKKKKSVSVKSKETIRPIQKKVQTVKQKVQPKYKATTEGTIFCVQILAVSKRVDTRKLQQKHHLAVPVTEHRARGIYKYTVGEFNTYRDAYRFSNDIRGNGLYDAFIVVFRNGEQIRLTSELKK